MTGSHIKATTTCPACGGKGTVPHAPGHYRVEVHYQDEVRRYDFSGNKAAWAKARRIAKGDPSANVAVIAPEGRVRSLDHEGRAIS